MKKHFDMHIQDVVSIRGRRFIFWLLALVLTSAVIATALITLRSSTFLQIAPNASTQDSYKVAFKPATAPKMYVLSRIPRSADNVTSGAIAGHVAVLDATTY